MILQVPNYGRLQAGMFICKLASLKNDNVPLIFLVNSFQLIAMENKG